MTGYDSPSSFTRAFKKLYAVTPSDIAQGELPRNELAGSLKPQKIFTDITIEPVWKAQSAQIVYGLYGKGFSEQFFASLAGQLFGRLAPLAEPLSYSQLQPIGVSIDNPWTGEQKQSRFLLGLLKVFRLINISLKSFIGW